jgi:SNF2 family DNA or RNA helicase
MQVINDRVLLVRTKFPSRITETIQKSKVVQKEGEVSEVAVNWGLKEAQILRTLNLKNVPSPIVRDYLWPGAFPPMAHQKDTASFLTLHKRAFCFNEQGTGKTAAAIWAADYLMNQGLVRRVLIICPLSIMQASWQSDLFKCAVHRHVGIAHGSREKRKAVVNSNAEFVVINYDGVETVAADVAADGTFDLIIVDEANAYKNVQTKRWKALKGLIAENTWLWMMTGTPAAQSPTDAFGLAKMTVPNNVPRFFGAFRDMVMYNISRFKWVPKPDAQNTIFNALQPAIRYTKEQCIDLPEITYTSRHAPLTPQQDKYYKILKNDMLMTAAGEEVSSVNAATNLNKLLQISGGAVYTDAGNTIEFDVSNRLSVVQEAIDEASHKVLVFVPFTHTIELLKAYLIKNGTTCEVINGQVPVNKRTDIIKRFQEQPEPRVLLIQPQAAAHGITLTAANVIIWYAPVTSIETYLQANARIHRQGQKNPMTVVHITGSPVENKLYSMLQNKLNTHTQLVDLYKNEIST